MTTTISTAGTTTISLSEWSTLIVSTTGAGSIEFASGAEKLKSSSTAKLTNTTYGPFGVPTTATVTLTTGSFTYDLGGIHNVTAQVDAVSGGRYLVHGPMISGEWVTVPSIFRLRMTGTGTVTLDSRDSLEVVTLGVFSATLSGATDDIGFPYAGDSAISIRANLTGTATAKVI